MFVVFWLSSCTIKNPGWGTPVLTARFKTFDNEVKAVLFYEAMTKRAADKVEYQSRVPSMVTKSW